MTIKEMLDSEEYQSWISDKLGNNLWLEDARRAQRLMEYAEEGLDGSTHAEVLNDWREFAEIMDDEKLLLEIEEQEQWWEQRGKLHSIVGD